MYRICKKQEQDVRVYGARGFALPTILIASIVMLSVMLVAVQAGSSTSVALNAQYYNQLASEASESGVAMAQACLEANSYVAMWTNTKPLTPSTDCSGNLISGMPYPGTVMSDGTTQTTFSVPAPTVSNGSQVISVNGTVNLLRTSTNTVWKSLSTTASSQYTAQESFSSVTFGYIYGGASTGAYFATKDAQGNILDVGANTPWYQLGNGTTSNTLSPLRYKLDGNATAQHVYTNFLSQGYSMFVAGSDNVLYGAGADDHGQLGNGAVSSSGVSSPVHFTFSSGAGTTAQYVAPLSSDTIVVGSDNRIYVAGSCLHGLLGNNQSLSGCTSTTDQTVGMPISLPVNGPNQIPSTWDGTLPATNMAADAGTVIVRMQGGAVYGWGENNYGELANLSTTDSSNPLQIGLYGNSGQPKATQVAFDGNTTYVLDDSGTVMAAGRNDYGQLGGGASPIRHTSTSACFDDGSSSPTKGTPIELKLCTANNATEQEFTWASDGSLQVHPNSTTTYCVDNSSNISNDGNKIQIWSCNGSAAQQWTLRSDGTIFNPSSGKCIDDPNDSSTDGVAVQLYQCGSSNGSQSYKGDNQLSLSPIQLPSSAGQVTKIATDQWSAAFLTTSGQVWSTGYNDQGQLGNNTTGTINMRPVQMILPSKAVNIYTTKSGGNGSYYTNTFAILDDGSVWGCGSDYYGQLGDGGPVNTDPSPNTSPVTTPVKMLLPNGVKAKEVESGLGTTIILTTDGRIFTVGNNAYGQLGDGTTQSRSIPQANQYTNVLPSRIY